MTITLAALLILALLGIVYLWVRFRENKRTANSIKPNRYNRTRRKKKSPSLGSNPLQQIKPDLVTKSYDSDSILGIKKQPMQQNSIKSQKSTNEIKNNNALPSVISLFLLAPKNHLYSGYELLQSLLTSGLRYGEMNIFHRYKHKTGRGPILFSLASAKEPGTFDLPKMGAFSTPALVLFMTINKVEEPLRAYEVMVETAGGLIEDLGGKVLDDQRNLLTREKIIEQRKLIASFEQDFQEMDFIKNNTGSSS